MHMSCDSSTLLADINPTYLQKRVTAEQYESNCGVFNKIIIIKPLKTMSLAVKKGVVERSRCVRTMNDHGTLKYKGKELSVLKQKANI